MAKAPTWNTIRTKMQDALKKANLSSVKSSLKAYKEYGNFLLKQPVSGNALMRGKDRLHGVVRREHLGRMIMFFYDPKLANSLPYYDRFPLVIPLEIYNDGFLGINLHYLPPMRRAQLLDAILNIYDNQHMDERRKLIMSYNLLRAYTRSRLYVPCIKRYLYTHMRSRFYMVAPEDWQMAVLLPTERFEKASKTRVFAESMMTVKR
jgi:hypothetical protein